MVAPESTRELLMFVPKHVLLVPALLVSAFALGVTGPAAAQGQAGGLTEEMNRGLQMSPLNQVVLPMYATAEECGATDRQLAALKRKFRDGSPELPAPMPGNIFDEFFDRNLPAARTKVEARMAGMSAAQRTSACNQLILPES